MNKPPEKIIKIPDCGFCPFSFKRKTYVEWDLVCTKLNRVITYEGLIPEDCPLDDAPVWLDAVKEPPKEEGSQLVYWGDNTYAWIMFDFEHGWVSEIDPLCWMPLPLPPERSGE
jgi:hypothetical protein